MGAIGTIGALGTMGTMGWTERVLGGQLQLAASLSSVPQPDRIVYCTVLTFGMPGTTIFDHANDHLELVI